MLALGALVLLIALGLGLYRSGPYSMRRDMLLTRLQAIQHLQVLEAHLLAHQSHSDPAFLNTNEFLIVARAKAVYGLDLAGLSIEPEGRSVRVRVPPVRLQELIVNPSDLEFLGLKKGLLTSQQAFETLKRSAAVDLQRELGRQAREQALITQAEANARQYLETLLRGLGYEQISISFQAGV